MRPVLLMLAFSTAVAMAAPAFAQDAERFRMERTENGFVRMDSRTGAMSFCEERGGQLICRDGADGRAGEAGQLAEFNRRIAELEDRIAALETRQPAQPNAGLPSEAEFEQTMTLMERFFRRFWGVARELERDSREPAPDRT